MPTAAISVGAHFPRIGRTDAIYTDLDTAWAAIGLLRTSRADESSTSRP